MQLVAEYNKLCHAVQLIEPMSFLSAKEAARRLGLSGSTVTRWCIQGRVPGAMKVANMWLVPEENLDKIERPAMGRPFNEKEETQENA